MLILWKEGTGPLPPAFKNMMTSFCQRALLKYPVSLQSFFAQHIFLLLSLNTTHNSNSEHMHFFPFFMGPKSDHCFALSLRQSVGIFRWLLVMMSNQTELKFAHEYMYMDLSKLLLVLSKLLHVFLAFCQTLPSGSLTKILKFVEASVVEPKWKF